MSEEIRTHKDLKIWQRTLALVTRVYAITEKFPKSEMWGLTNQIRRSSRSVCANIAEVFRKRKYPKSFISKLSDAEGEAAETQVWIQLAFSCN
jgi:four helix bundle protein